MRKVSNTNSGSSNNKSRKSENLGKGKVTPVQIAFIVDRYLSDNNYTKTRSSFRSEASNLMSKTSLQEAPKSLLSLGAILDEYICLKEQKVSLEQEWCRIEEEKSRVHNLLMGIQDAMNAFNSTAHDLNPPPPTIPKSGVIMPPNIDLPIGSSPGYYSAYNSPAVISVSKPSITTKETPTCISSEITNHTDVKRKGSIGFNDACLTAKRSRRSSTAKQLPPKDTQPNMGDNHQVISHKQTAAQSVDRAHASGESKVESSNAVQSSHVVKCLFNQPVQSPPINYSDPKTPPLASFSQAEKSASPMEICSTATSSKDVTPPQITSTNCNIMSSETIRVSPAKQMSYYSIARNQNIFTSSPVKANLKKPNMRDHVKGRLDFDAPKIHIASEKPVSNEISRSECVKEVDILDLDLPGLDALGDINLSQLLVDFDIADDGTSYSTQPAVDSSPDSISWSPQKSVEVNIGATQVFTQLSSTVTEILAEKDTTSPDSVTTVKSVTKTIKILSPAKSHRSSSDSENLPVKNRLD
ncbi:hypothetical protein ACH5RR_005264 [Cinchona calisaya]|uniref:LisH domain-containing protein n=1 Tax=Cinchona calisaya TaxID=153742 RepID=A0ABD3AKQ9_9GENT